MELMDWNLDMASSFDSHLIIIFRLMLNAMLLGAWKIKTQLINFGKTEERLLFFFYCKMAMRPFTLNNEAFSSRAAYGAEINLEITYFD